jgi:AsmA protein
MKRFAFVLAGLFVVIIVGGAIALAIALNGIALKTRLTAALAAATGRDVIIAGPVDFTFYPNMGFNAADVSIGNAPGGREARMLDARRMTIGVAVMPLFRHELEVVALHLIEPVASLEILPDGTPNWLLKPKPGTESAGTFKPKLDQVRLRDVTIEKGKIGFYNALTHAAYAVDDAGATIDLDGLDKPLRIKGAGVYAGERAKIDATITTPQLLLAAKPVNLALTLEAAPLSLRFEGVMQPGAKGLNGALTASGPDLRRLAAWGGHPIGQGGGINSFSVRGQLVYGGHATQFNNAAVTLDAISARGDLMIETSAAKPLISGRLEVPTLDLNPYLAKVNTATAATGASPSTAPSAAPPANAPPRASGIQPIDVRAAGYDTAPLDYTGLRNFNANLDLSTGVLQVHKTRIDRARMTVVLIDGFLAATLTQMDLYGGQGHGAVRIDARGSPLRFEEQLDVDNVRSLGLFSDAFGFSALDATANITLNLAAEGLSQQDLISNLRGSGAFYFSKGAFKGIDFGGLTRTVKNLMSGKVTGPDAQTPFDQFAATVQIARGVLAFRDFKLDGPRLQVLGQGGIDLGRQSLDLRFSPRTVFARDKNTGLASATGIPLPFRASGQWTGLKFTTDITGQGKREQEREICAVTRDC